jgi:alcohol dehydrogenase class IV
VAFTCAFVGYVHAIAHGVGGRYHTQHGLANAVILPYVLEEFGPAIEGELADLAWAIGLTGDDNHELAQAFIAAVRSLGASMDIPEHLEEIQAADIRELARGAEQEGNPGYPVPAIWDVPTFERVIARVAGVA